MKNLTSTTEHACARITFNMTYFLLLQPSQSTKYTTLLSNTKQHDMNSFKQSAGNSALNKLKTKITF